MNQQDSAEHETRAIDARASRLSGWLLLAFIIYAWLMLTCLYSWVSSEPPRIPVRAAGEINDGIAVESPIFQLDINIATEAQLQALPDIGPRLAERVVVDRKQNGPFGSPEELQRVRGFGPKTLEKLRPMLIVSD